MSLLSLCKEILEGWLILGEKEKPTLDELLEKISDSNPHGEQLKDSQGKELL